MIDYLVGAVVAIIFIALVGLVVDRGRVIAEMTKVVGLYAIRAEKAEQELAGLHTIIKSYQGRVFEIAVNDAQIQTLSERMVAAMPKALTNSNVH